MIHIIHYFISFLLYICLSDILDSAFQRCPLCGLTAAGYMDLDAVFELDPDALEMIILNILHFGLRIFSFLLKIGYHKYFKVNLIVEEIFLQVFSKILYIFLAHYKVGSICS